MTDTSLFDEIRELLEAQHRSEADIADIKRAFDYAAKLHEGQYRISEEPYIIHPVEVAKILIDLMEDKGIKLGLNYSDCGQMYFRRDQKTLCGASGCGCAATVFNSYIMKKLQDGQYKRVLFMPTGALLSTTATQQGESVPGVCHAIVVESYED